VYRARDAKLNRDVAIKVLLPAVANDPDRLTRFEREAKSIAQLSHPNILGIFDFGQADAGQGGVTYAVMELLEGETLRDRLATGALPARKAIEYGVQIAHGLAAAHNKGIAHRDLKPENLFITLDDRLKILDFGLAKPLDLGAASATVANTVGTAAGVVLGTVGYMAPEQVRGLATDHRADIFSFGAVLYEMITGRRAFEGDTAADTISAILNREPPDLETVTGAAPLALDRIVRRCLEKKPELRFQSAHDLAFALETLSARGSGPVSDVVATTPVAKSSRQRIAAAFPWAIAVLAVAGAASWAIAMRAPARPPSWQAFTPVTDAAGEETSPSISPDGSTIAYASRASGTWDIYVQRVGGRNATAIAADPERNETAPAFSPDGKSLAFHVSDGDGGIFIAGATGESSRRLSDFGFHPAWSPDSAQIAFSTEEIYEPAGRNWESALWVVDVAGGTPRRIDVKGDVAQPSWSPSGERFVYWSNTGGQRDIFTVAVAGGPRTPVVEDAPLDWCPIWAPDGRSVLFASNRGGSTNLWRIGIDQASGRTIGIPEPMTGGVQADIEQPVISMDGRRLVFRSRTSAISPVSIAFDPVTGRTGTPVVLNNSDTRLDPSDVSPDGRWIAYSNVGDRQEDIFISAIDGSGLRRITDDGARDRAPSFTPDGRSLVFYSNRSGQWDAWRIDRDGGNLRKFELAGHEVNFPLLSPSGEQLVATDPNEGAFLADLRGAKPSVRSLEHTTLDGQRLIVTAWSPAGSQLAGYLLPQSGNASGVGIYHLESATLRKVSGDRTYGVRWLSDGRRVLYLTESGEVVVLDTVSSKRTVLTVRLPLLPFAYVFALSKDDRTILYGGARSESDIWIVERK